MGRWGPRRLKGGPVAQGGLNVQDRHAYKSRFTPRAILYRGIVIRSYVHDDPANTSRSHRVTADVLLAHSQIPLYRVPVLQQNYGVNNVHGLWVPRGTTRALNGADLTLTALTERGTRVPGSGPTDLGQLDGDQVLIGFIEGDLDLPVVVSAFDHESSNREIQTAAGTPEFGVPQKDEYYVHHYGTELRISADGDLLIDALNAYGKENAETGEEDATQGQGEIRIRIKEDRRVTIEVNGTDVFEVWQDGGQVRIDLGEGATERLILGDTFRSFFNDFITNIFNLHTHNSGTGPTDVPNQTQTTMPESHLSDLAKTKQS